VAGVKDQSTAVDSPPRRLWLLGIVGAVVAGGIGWSAFRRRTSKQAPMVAAAGVPQLLDFGMDICEQCKKTRALLTRIEPEYAGKLQVRYVDVRQDANDVLAEKYRMRVIPLLVLLDRDGAETWRHEGAPSEAVLREQISQAIANAQRPRPAVSPAPSASASTLAHDHGRTRCACEQQSMNAVPWILTAAVVLLGFNWLAGRRKAAERNGRAT
jgi:thioredoxin 1